MRAIAAAIAILLVTQTAVANEPNVTRLNLGETASRDLADDRYVATLQGQGEGADAAAAQAALNRQMREALAAVADVDGLEATTESYWVQAREREDETVVWIARQSLRLETADRELLLDHVSPLQALGLSTQLLGSRLSAAGHASVRDELTAEALTALRDRAMMVAATLGLRFDGFAEVSLDGMRPMPMPRAAMMEARADAPVMTEGSSTVSVTVSATALMGPAAP